MDGVGARAVFGPAKTGEERGVVALVGVGEAAVQRGDVARAGEEGLVVDLLPEGRFTGQQAVIDWRVWGAPGSRRLARRRWVILHACRLGDPEGRPRPRTPGHDPCVQWDSRAMGGACPVRA